MLTNKSSILSEENSDGYTDYGGDTQGKETLRHALFWAKEIVRWTGISKRERESESEVHTY